jgi:hypothetical protein
MNIELFRAAAILAVTLYAVSTGLFFLLHVIQSPYKLTTHAVSDYGVGVTAGLFQFYAWTGTAAALILAILFYFAQKPTFPPIVFVCMLSMVVSRIGVSVFKTDLEGAPRTRQGILHYLFAILTFAFAYTAIANATPVLMSKTAFSAPLLVILQYIAMISLGCVVITLLKPLHRFFAIAERVFLLSTLLWFLVTSCLFI